MPMLAASSTVFDVEAPPSFEPLQSFFEKNAETYPDKKALVFMGESLSYRNLNNRANQLAWHLIESQLEKESVIAVFLKRGIDIIVSMLGILKAGYAFLMIDDRYPMNRVQFILADSRACVLLVDQETLKRLDHAEYLPSTLLMGESLCSKEKVANPNLHILPGQLAYVIYTSGSTGLPKGVLIEHRGMMNTLLNSIDIFGVEPDDRVLCVLSFSFDASILEVASALIVGGILYLTSEEQRSSFKKLSQLIFDNEISVAVFTPSLLRLLPQKALSQLRILISGGELCTPDLIEKGSDTCRFFNVYGPTEASIITTIHLCRKGESVVGVGKPLKNVSVHVLRENLKPVATGEIGILFIEGLGLARGYLNHPELTRERFIDISMDKNRCVRLYNTGDRARFNDDGSLEYLGRVDEEIKINGNRLNLSEVSSALLKHPRVTQCLVKKSERGRKQKILAIIESEGHPLELKEMRQYLSQFLPKYALPHQLIHVAKMPLSVNGKISISSRMRIETC